MPTDAPTPDPSERPEVEPLSAEEVADLRSRWNGSRRGVADRVTIQTDQFFATIDSLTAERDALSAEVARLEKAAAFNRGIYATLESERDDIERSYLATCQRLDDSEVEVALLWETVHNYCHVVIEPGCPICAALHPVSEEGPPPAPEAPTGPVLGVCDTWRHMAGVGYVNLHAANALCVNWRPVAPEGTEGEG